MKLVCNLLIGAIVAGGIVTVLPVYGQHIFILVALYGSLALAWNVLGGMTGQISLGHAIFVGAGAYVATALYLQLGVNPWIGFVCATLVGGALGGSLGCIVFRRQLSGVFFALVTLAIAEMARHAVSNISGLGAANGLAIPPQHGLANFQFSKTGFCYAALALLLVVSLAVIAIQRSRLGYVFRSIRENERAAAAVGIDVIQGKVIAAALSGALAALTGPFYANYVLFIDPESMLGIPLSIDALLFAFVGGLGSLFGPLLGAAVLVPLTELLRGLFSSRFAGIHLIAYGVVLIVVIRVAPQGLWGLMADLIARRAK